MPKFGPRVPNPHEKASDMATVLMDRIDGVPWPTTAFLKRTKSGAIRLESFRSNDPSCERLRHSSAVEIGTYTRGEYLQDLIGDIETSMVRVR